MGIPDELQNKHSVHTLLASIWARGRHARRIPSTEFADSDTGAATRGTVRACKATATTRIRRNTGTQHGHSGTRAATTQSVCGPTSENARKGFHGGKTGISLSDTNGTNARKITIPLDRPVLDSGSGKRNIFTGYASRRHTTPESKQVSIKALLRTYATKSFPRRTRNGRKIQALTTEAHMYYNVSLKVVPYRYP